MEEFENDLNRSQHVQMRHREPDSWPIKLVMKCGAQSKEQAGLILVVISVILLIITIVIYKNLLFPSQEIDINSLPPEARFELERQGIELPS